MTDGIPTTPGELRRDQCRKVDERRLADLQAGNARTERALAAQGVRLNEQAVVALQVRALIRFVVDGDPVRQLAFDLAYQQSVSEGLAEVATDLARKKLTAGNGAGRLVTSSASFHTLKGG